VCCDALVEKNCRFWTISTSGFRHLGFSKALRLRRMYFSIKSAKIHEKNTKNITLRYLHIVVVIKYSLLNPRWRKPEVEMVQNRQFIATRTVFNAKSSAQTFGRIE